MRENTWLIGHRQRMTQTIFRVLEFQNSFIIIIYSLGEPLDREA